MLLLPLQSLWAAVELYHVHVSAAESNGLEKGHLPSLSDMVHEHDHDHDHEHPFKHNNTTADSTESDHHHHCTGHFAVVLPGVLGDLQPDLQYDELSSVPALSTSSYYSRIERPNWC